MSNVYTHYYVIPDGVQVTEPDPANPALGRHLIVGVAGEIHESLAECHDLDIADGLVYLANLGVSTMMVNDLAEDFIRG